MLPFNCIVSRNSKADKFGTMYNWKVKGIKVVVSSTWWITIEIRLSRHLDPHTDPKLRKQSKNILTLKHVQHDISSEKGQVFHTCVWEKNTFSTRSIPKHRIGLPLKFLSDTHLGRKELFMKEVGRNSQTIFGWPCLKRVRILCLHKNLTMMAVCRPAFTLYPFLLLDPSPGVPRFCFSFCAKHTVTQQTNQNVFSLLPFLGERLWWTRLLPVSYRRSQVTYFQSGCGICSLISSWGTCAVGVSDCENGGVTQTLQEVSIFTEL